MLLAAYQAHRPYPATGGAELVVPFLHRAKDQGVDVVCCPEALIGELANESDGDTPATVALSVEDGQLLEAIAPLFGWPMTIVIGFTERTASGALHNSAAVVIDGELGASTASSIPALRCAPPGRTCRSSRTPPVASGC